MKRLLLTVCAAAILTTGAACGGNDDEETHGGAPPGTVEALGAATVGKSVVASETAVSETASATVAVTPQSQVLALEFFNVSDFGSDGFLVRFVATVENLEAESVEGMAIRWDAFDESGALVGSHESQFPVVGPGESFTYVGGASHLYLSARPSDILITVTDSGEDSDAPSGLLPGADITVAEDQFGGTYSVTGVVTIGSSEVPRSDLNGVAILRDSDGKIVGADFTIMNSLPETIPAGTPVRLEMSPVATGEVASAQLFAYVK